MKRSRLLLTLFFVFLNIQCAGVLEGTPLASNRNSIFSKNDSASAKKSGEKNNFFKNLFAKKQDSSSSSSFKQKSKKHDDLNEVDLADNSSKKRRRKNKKEESADEKTEVASLSETESDLENEDLMSRDEIDKVLNEKTDTAAAKPARKLTPNPASQGLVTKAIAQMDAKNLSAAEWSLEEAIRLSPNYGPAYFWMAKVNYDKKDYGKARRFLDKAEMLLPEDGDWPGKLQTLKTKIALGGL